MKGRGPQLARDEDEEAILFEYGGRRRSVFECHVSSVAVQAA